MSARSVSAAFFPAPSHGFTPWATAAPSSVIMQAEGIKSETQWFSKKVNAFIAVFIPPQPWGWKPRVHTNTTTLPPWGQTEPSQGGKGELAAGIKGLQPLPAAASLKPSDMGGLLASDASKSTQVWYCQAVQEVVLSWIN